MDMRAPGVLASNPDVIVIQKWIACDNCSKIYVSQDGGLTWEDKTGNLFDADDWTVSGRGILLIPAN
jgi:hypothetical protein